MRRAAVFLPIVPAGRNSLGAMVDLIGREREQARLRSLLNRTTEGEGGVALIRGEAGIGKTSIARWLIDLARSEGCTCLHGRAHSHGSLISYGPLVEALGREFRRYDAETVAALTDRIAGLSTLLPGLVHEPELPSVPDELALTRTLEAIRATLVRLAAARPVILSVDDVQWADAATLRALSYVAGELDGAPILLVLTLREGEDAARPDVRNTMAAVRRVAQVDELAPSRLDATEVARLLESLTDGPVRADIVAEVVRRSAGTPLFVEALGQELLDRGVGPFIDRGDRVEPPTAIDDAIRERFDGLDPTARRVLVAVSLSSGAIGLDQVQAVTGFDDDAADLAVVELRTRGLISVADDAALTVEVAHPVIAEVVENTLSPLDRAKQHETLLDALGPDADPEVASTHVNGASGRVPADRAIDVLTDAARQAAGRQAYRSAAAHAGRALELAEPLGDVESELAIRNQLASALFALGEHDDADLVAREALRLRPGDPTLLLPALMQVELIGWFRGEGDAELAQLEAALDAVPDDDVRPVVLRALVQRVGGHSRRRSRQTRDAIADLLRRTDGRTDPEPRSVNLLARCYELELVGEVYRIGPLAAEIEQLAAPGGLGWQLHRARIVALDAALVTGPVELVQARAAAVREMSHPLYVSWRDPIVTHVAGLARLESGWLQPVEPSSGSAVDEIAPALPPVIQAHRAWIAADRDAMDAIGPTGAVGRTTQRQPTRPSDDRDRAVTSGFAALLTDDHERASAALDALTPPIAHVALELVTSELIGRLAVMTGDDVAVAAVLQRLRTNDGGDGWASAHARKIEAMSIGGPAGAETMLDAADRFLGVGDRHQEAECLTVADELADGSGAAAAIDDRLLRLIGPVERAGLDRLGARMRAAVGDRSRDAPAPPESSPLTERQLEIAELVAQGLSNAAIADRLTVAVRTVGSHLDHIYTRLGINNRTELAVRLPELR